MEHSNLSRTGPKPTQPGRRPTPLDIALARTRKTQLDLGLDWLD